MYTKHIELYGIEALYRMNDDNESHLKRIMGLMDMVFDLGYQRGKEETVFNIMMGVEGEK